MISRDTDWLNGLNEVQRAAVLHTEGPAMIIAGAGSGKTRVITFRIAYLLSQGVDAFQILALTFTNKAAREMRERIVKITGEKEARNLWMGTFHSIFSRILRVECEKINYPNNFSIYDSDDSRSLLRTILKEMNLDDKVYKPNQVHARISEAKNNLISATAYLQNENLVAEDYANGKPKLGEIYMAYQKRLFKASAMDFDDLLFKTYELFYRFPDVLYKYQHRFKYIMVDEYQDTNLAQYVIVKQLAAVYQNLCVVGDDAQSIYAFRGANIQNILNFEKDYPDVATFKLEQNYRSTQNIVEGANTIIKNNKFQLKKNVFTENEEGDKIAVYKAQSDNEEGRLVAQLIFEEKMNNRLENKDFAILYRTNSQSRSMEEALRKMNLPYRVYGGLSFYQRKEIKDLLAYCRLALNPRDEEALKRIINYPTRGIGTTTVEKLVVLADQNNTDLFRVIINLDKIPNHGINTGTKGKLYQFATMIQSFAVLARNKNAYDAAQTIASESKILKELFDDKTPEGVSRYENIMELLNGIKEFSEEPNEDGELQTLDKFMADVALLTDADNDNEEGDKISMMTIHSAKGLEFPYVYIVGMEENLFPSQLSSTSREELEEERRLFYVALTRAMKKVSLSYAQSRFRWGNLTFTEPSRFLAEMDQSRLDVRHAGVQQKPSRIDADDLRDGWGGSMNYNYSKPPGQSTAKPAAAVDPDFVADNPRIFNEGMEVLHQRFGKGKILRMEGSGSDRMATIQFEAAGEKKLVMKFAKLKALPKEE
ncbi:MAG: UvrD-helicase domain-containing protein [Bacteroidia bacterium]|nr:UvrD-helicase domain-containing protein [Bacteroidia bacterium]